MQSYKVVKKFKFDVNVLYIAPLFIFIALFLLMPFLTAIVKSFYRYDVLSINEFIGLENYKTLFFEDAKFRISIVNLLILMGGMVICFQMPILAAKLTQSLHSNRVQYVFRTIFLVPIAVPAVVTLLMWKFMYYPEIGVISNILSNFGMKFPNVFGIERYTLPAIILIGFPWVSGLGYIIIYSALQSIDSSILESAKIDGSGGIRTFFKIEIPLIMPQIKVLFVLAIIGLIQDYERFLILTNGGPNNASLVPGLHMYKLAFGDGESLYGYSSAIAVVLFVFTLIISVLIMKKRGDE